MGWRRDPDSEEEELNEELVDESDDEFDVAIPRGGYAGLAGFAVGLAVGALLGAGAALLTTPMRGGAMRRRIRHGVEELSDDLLDRAGRIREDANRSVDRTKRRIKKARRRR